MEQAGDQAGRKKIVSVMLAVLLLVTLLAVTVYQWRLKELTISIDQRSMAITTLKDTVGDVLEENNVDLGKFDAINVAADTPLKDGMEIEITRAFEVNVKEGTADPIRVVTLPATVEIILKNAGVELGAMDEVRPGRGETIFGPGSITVIRVAREEIKESKEIPFATVSKRDPNLESGLRRVLQEGHNGEEVTRWEVTYSNGEEISRREIGSQIIRQPQNRVIAEGTLQLASRSGNDLRFKKVLVAEATAYTHTGNLTHTDTQPRKGTIAVDPRIISLGSKLFVENYGYGRAEDIGSAIKGDRVDLFFETRQEALRWGRKDVKVYILE